MILLSLNTFLFLCAHCNNRLIFRTSFFVVLITLTLTYGYGYDWINYYDTYQSIQRGHYTLPFEPGYYLIMRFFALIDAPYQAMSAFTTSLILWLTYLFCRNTKNPGVSFFVIFSFMGFFMFTEQIRQGMAVCLMMLSIQLFEKRSNLKAILMIIVAMLFHVSAIICLLYVFIVRGNHWRDIIRYMTYVSFAILLILYTLSKPSILSFIPYVYLKLQGYSNSYSEDIISIIRIFFSKGALINIFLLFLFSIVNDRDRHLSLSIKAIFFIIITKTAHFLVRFQFYFVPFIVLGFDRYLGSSRSKYRILVKNLYLIAVLLISFSPVFSDIYYKSMNSPLFVTATESDINKTITTRCSDLYDFDPQSNNIGICVLLKNNYQN